MQPYRLPNDDINYCKSPVAQHAIKVGTLDREKGQKSVMNNGKMRLKDSFTTVFPTYTH